MKVEFSTGCTVHDTSFDNKSLILMDFEDVKKNTLYLINNLPDTYAHKTDILEDIIDTLISDCEHVSEVDCKYGDEKNESIFTNTISTKSHRIRTFYDSATHKMWITIDDDYDFDEMKFDFLKHVLSELVEEYSSHPRFNDEHTKKVTLNGICGSIMSNFGVIEHVSKRCECCGDNICTYVLEI